MAKKKSSKSDRDRVPIYRTYMFQDKDPIIDMMRTLADDSSRPYSDISNESGVSKTTLYNWFHGKTRRPQFCTIAAVAGALGKTVGLISKKK